MGSLHICEGSHLGFWVFLLFSVSFCYGNADQVQVVGIVECADCSESHIKASQAFSGMLAFQYLHHRNKITRPLID